MIERYRSPDDAVPHEATVLVLDEADERFETPYEALFDEVDERVPCDSLEVVEHYERPGDLPEHDQLIQYNVWLIHHSALTVDGGSTILSYLCTESFPDETQVALVVDADDDSVARNLRREIPDEVVTLSSRAGLVGFLLGHLTTANPCSVSGMEYVLAWNEEIADRVGRQREIE